jgi:hypothetical protein
MMNDRHCHTWLGLGGLLVAVCGGLAIETTVAEARITRT